MSCRNCPCSKAPPPDVPVGGMRLYRRTSECLAIDLVGERVVKHLRCRPAAAQHLLRAAIAAAHADLFATPWQYDAATHTLVQPWVDGRPATREESAAVADVLKARGESRVYDLATHGNVLVTADGRAVIVDFCVNDRQPRPKKPPGIYRRGRTITIVPPLTAEQRAELRAMGW